MAGRLPCGLDLLHSLAGPQQAPLLYRASGLSRARMFVDSGGYGHRKFPASPRGEESGAELAAELRARAAAVSLSRFGI